MLRKIDKTADYIAAILLGVMAILVFMLVIFRYLLHLPLDWGEELSRYLFIWSSMLGAAIALKRKSHFGMDFLVKTLPSNMRRYVAISVSLCVCALLVVVAVQGAKLTIINFSQVSPTILIPMAVPYAAIPISGFLMLISMISQVWEMFSDMKMKGQG